MNALSVSYNCKTRTIRRIPLGGTTRSLSGALLVRPLAAKWFGQENPGRTSYLSKSLRNISAFLRFTTFEMLIVSLAKAHWSR